MIRAGVEVLLLDDDELVLHRPAGRLEPRGSAVCGTVLDRFTAGLATALEPWARSLCADCWPASDGPL